MGVSFGEFELAPVAGAAGRSLPGDPQRPTLLFVVEGRLAVRAGGRSHALRRGSVLFLPPAIPRVQRCRSQVEALLVGVPPRHALPSPALEAIGRAWSLTFIREVLEAKAGWQRIAEGLAIESLGHLARRLQLAGTRPPWLHEVIRLAREGRTLDEIATLVGRHASHVSREFRRHEEVSVGEFARRCRLERAAGALRQGRESISEIALESGFCDQSHFTNAFRRVFGVTPARYRRDHGEGCAAHA